MPAVSIVLPTRRRPNLVGRALASILNQTWKDFEVVLVDDNDDAERLRTRGELSTVLSDRRIVLIEDPHPRNAAKARNLGLNAARGDWITYLDDDDEYTADKVARQLALADGTGDALVTCGYEVRMSGRRRIRQARAAGFQGDALLTGVTWGTPFLFHRRDKEAAFDEELDAGEDVDFALDYVRRHNLKRVSNVAAPLVIVHLQPQRVNLDRQAQWRAAHRILWRSRFFFSRQARRLFLWRARLAFSKFPEEPFGGFVRSAAGLLMAGGVGECRAVGNAALHRHRWFRRWLVS